MDHELKSAERMLKPHVLLLQVIASRFQAVKYRAPGIMISIIRMLLKSFRAHESMRYSSSADPSHQGLTNVLLARTLSPERSDSASCCLASKCFLARA